MDENIKLQPEEEGKEFGYFPFEELPPVTTQVVEEVIKCEIGNINIQHTDPIEINTDIHLPLKDNKLAKLQESGPTHQTTKETVGKQKLGPKHVHDGKQHPKMKTHQKRTLVHTHSSSRHPKRLSPYLSTQQTRPQWIQKNIRIFEKQIPLEGHEEISVSTLHKLPSLRKIQHQNSTAEKRTFLITTPTNGIHSNGPNRRIPPIIQQGQ